MGRELIDINEIAKSFKSEGYNLITTDYKSSTQKLKFICPKGHVNSISWGSWKHQNGRCSICSGRYLYDIHIVRSMFASEDYRLLSDSYNTVDDKLNYICPNGHISSIKLRDWNSGYRCYFCFDYYRRGNNFKKTVEEVKKEIKEKGYKLLSKEYKDAHTKLYLECPKGHKFSMDRHSFLKGQRCPICNYINKFGENNPAWCGGKSLEDYCDIFHSNEFKDMIKERDNHECQNPSCYRTSNRLVIHHIDYNKKNCSLSNLITVCNSCNVRANIHRDKWYEFYTFIMNNRGNIYG